MLRGQWRSERMAREPVVTYSRRPSAPPGSRRAGGTVLSAVEVPFVDPLEAAMRAAAAATRPGALTLAVLASVAGIAASVAVIAAAYDATVLQPQRVVTAVPVTVPIVARSAPSRTAVDPIVVASVAPVPAATTAGVPAASPATGR